MMISQLELLIGTSLVLFLLGVLGVIIRRNLLVILMSLELMLNAVNLALIAFARHHGNTEGHLLSMMIFVVAAAEVAIGIAIIVNLFKHRQTISLDRFVALRR